MRIFFLNTMPIWGGCERWVVQVGKCLQERGHEVVVSSLPGSETEQNAQNAGLRTFPFKIGIDVAFWKMPILIKYFKNHQIEVVVCVQNRDVKVGALAAKLANVPVVLVRNGLDIIKKKLYHKLAFTKFVDGIMTNAMVLKETYMKYGWFEDDFIHVIYDGLQLPGNIENINLRETFGFPDDFKIIVSAGRIVEQKGFDFLIDAAAIARENGKKWGFIIFGEGKLEKVLKEKADTSRVTNTLRFSGFKSNILPYMKDADLFVISSRSEGLSSVLREAMSAGKACVATNVNGVQELFQDGRAGLMVEKNNPQALYEGLDLVLSNPALKQKYEKNALERIKEDFQEEIMIDHLEALFHKYLDKKSKTKL